MKVIILGGFLGSGKTTVLLQLAEAVKKASTAAVPLVILENEIGEVSVDGSLLRGYELREIYSGCICCTLAGDLTAAIRDIRRDYNPDYVLVETTGMAIPARVAQTIRTYAPDIPVEIWVLADASRWEEMMDFMDVFLKSQLSGADRVLLNKTDLVTPEETERVADSVHGLCPEAEITAMSAKENRQPLLYSWLEGAKA